MINEKEKQEKILNFNMIVGNQNNNVANEFLSLGNWNVSEAVNIYLYSFSNSDSFNNQNNLLNFKYISEYSFINSGIFRTVTSFFQSPFLKNNADCCNKFIGKIKCLVKTGESFTNLLKTNKGIIILYNNDTIVKLNQQLDIINNDNLYTNYLNTVLIYPIINDSIEGKNLINFLQINRFPCYLFCKYKSNNVFYIIDKMEGIFYLQTFKSTLFPQINNSNINHNNSNIKHENKIQNQININEQNKNKINLNNNKSDNNNKSLNNNKDQNLINIKKENLNNNKINNIPNNEIHSGNEIKKINNNENNHPNQINNEFSILNNGNQSFSDIYKNFFGEDNIKENNNNKKTTVINQNNKKNSNIPEYIPDYREYQFDLDPIYPLDQVHPPNQNRFPSQSNNNLNNNKSKTVINPNNKNNKKIPEYIPDYRDYQFDNEPIYPIHPINPVHPPNQNQNKVQPHSNNNLNNLNDNGDLLSDSEYRKCLDTEIKELERMEEEKQKKEREEKEKKRKEEEEKKKQEQKEKEDKELFSMLIPPEPSDDNPDKCIIVFRLPDGEKNIQRKFLKTDKIAVLYDYIRSLGKEIYSEEGYHNFSIIQTFPFKNFENKLNNTLEEEGLFPNSMLQIKENN